MRRSLFPLLLVLLIAGALAIGFSWQNRLAAAEAAQQKVTHFLSHPEERATIAASMRQRVLDRLTYTAITRRLLGMIAGDLAKQADVANL